MPKILSLLLFLFAFFQASPVTSMSFSDINPEQLDIILNYDSYTVADGLSQNTVTSIVEDSEGYIWIGTVNGLNRFDGTEFTHFYAEDNGSGLPSSFIRNLMIDDQDRLLIGTDKGLAIFDKYTETFSLAKQNHPISDAAIWATYSKNGLNYVGLNNEVYVFNNDFSNEKFNIKNKKLKEVKKIIVSEENIYVRNYDGDIFKINNKNEEKILTKTNDFSVINKKLLYSNDNGLYFKDKKISSKKINNILHDHNKDLILVFTNDELYSIKQSVNELSFSVNKIGEFDIKSTKNGQLMTQFINDGIYLSNYTDGIKKYQLKII